MTLSADVMTLANVANGNDGNGIWAGNVSVYCWVVMV